jgi:hypothetical protein
VFITGAIFRYTGYIPALHETVAKTPTHAQDKTFHPEDHTFLRERKKPPVINPERDSCNDKSVYSKGHVKGETVNLWPDLQDSVWPETEDLRPESAKPQAVHIVHGDRRIRVRNPLLTAALCVQWCVQVRGCLVVLISTLSL